MREEVKYLAFASVVSASFFALVMSADANHFSLCYAGGCNVTTVWWNDTVNATGVGSAAVSVTVRVDGTPVCSTTTAASGGWSCQFQAPNQVGSYNLSVAVGSVVDESVLRVRPVYGLEPSGTNPRFVIESPLATLEPSGRTRVVLSRLTVSEGLPS